MFHSHRLGAFGVTAALTLAGGGLVANRCAPAPAPPAPAPSASDTALDVSDAVIASVNEHRAAAGLGALAGHGALASAATSHASDQAAMGTMTHTGSNGSSAGDRLSAAGYAWSTWGENVAAGQTTAADVMSAWMASAPHRANVLSGAFSHIGVAAVTGANGTTYWAMVLAAGG